jgi:prepilin-type processing-associated H-X9-DG protein
MQCTNNLHNLAIACHNYHDSLGTYPNAFFYAVAANDTICSGTPTNCEEWGWNVLIMPYIEQQNLFNNLGALSYSLHHVMGLKNPALTSTTAVSNILKTKLPIFICPSDSNPNGDVNATRHFGSGLGTVAGNLGSFQGGVSNYMVNRGTDNRSRPNNDTFGVFMESHAKKMQDITDGTSNTFMLGERDTQLCNSGTWIGVRNPPGTGGQGFYTVTANVYVRLNSPVQPYSDAAGCLGGFSSLHMGGANFALCDGSVRFVTNNIDFKVDTGVANQSIRDAHVPRDPVHAGYYSIYTRLGRRNDGYPVGDF